MKNSPETIQSNLKELELNALLEVTEAINSNLPESSLYKIYHFTLLANLRVKKLALFVLGDEWECKVWFGVEEQLLNQIDVSAYKNITGSVNLYDGVASKLFEHVIAVHHKNRLLALVFASEPEPISDGNKGKSSTTFLEALTNILLVAIENKKLARKQLEQEAFNKELEIAQQVQQFLIPKDLPKTERLTIDAVYMPHHNIGGDYYDYIPLSEERFMVCVADVSGKGVPAALMMSNFQASLRTLVRQTDDLATIVQELNYHLYRSGNAEIFITFFVSVYDFSTRQMQYANCGHNPQFLIAASQRQSPIKLEKGTTVLGIFEPIPFLEIGTLDDLNEFCLFGYTDGLTEVFNEQNEEYGEMRLQSFIKENACRSPFDFNQKLLEEVELFRKGRTYSDDLTMVAVTVKA